MSLLQQVNESANKSLVDQAVMTANIARIDESLPDGSQPLTEAVTDWLAGLRNHLAKGTLTPDQKTKFAHILGALAALSNPDNAEAFDDINRLGLGTVLYNASAKRSPESAAAIDALYDTGREPSNKKFVDSATQAMEDPRAINELIGKLQTSIDQVMRTAIAKQKGGATSATGGGGVGGSPERAA